MLPPLVSVVAATSPITESCHHRVVKVGEPDPGLPASRLILPEGEVRDLGLVVYYRRRHHSGILGVDSRLLGVG